MLPIGIALPHVPDASSLGVYGLIGSQVEEGGVLGDSWLQPLHHPDGDSEAPEWGGRTQRHTESLVPPSLSLCPTGSGDPHTPAPDSSAHHSPPPPCPTTLPGLTLQFLVPSFPLEADGSSPVVDEALEAGILSLLHSAAGRVDRDDRAPKAWEMRQAKGWAQDGQVG